MKNKKQKIKKGMVMGIVIIFALITIGLGLNQLLTYVGVKGVEARQFIEDPVKQICSQVTIKAPRKEEKKVYKYNERVPKDVIIEEMNSLGRTFKFDKETMQKWFDTIQCESGFNNLAKNKNSTGLGLAQYLIGTWEETESFKQFRIARTDVKASLWEMALDIANGETWRWECWE